MHTMQNKDTQVTLLWTESQLTTYKCTQCKIKTHRSRFYGQSLNSLHPGHYKCTQCKIKTHRSRFYGQSLNSLQAHTMQNEDTQVTLLWTESQLTESQLVSYARDTLVQQETPLICRLNRVSALDRVEIVVAESQLSGAYRNCLHATPSLEAPKEKNREELDSCRGGAGRAMTCCS